MEVPVGQEAELQRRHRALDGHVDHVDDEPAAVERGQRRLQRGGTFGRVEGEDLLHPPGTREPFGLLGHEDGAGGDDEHVVAEHRPVLEVDLVGGDVDVVDGAVHVADAVMELAASRSHDVLENCRSSACATLGYASTQAGAGETIVIEPGTYIESGDANVVPSSLTGLTISLAGPPTSTVMDETGTYTGILIEASGVSIKGLTVDNAQLEGILAEPPMSTWPATPSSPAP